MSALKPLPPAFYGPSAGQVAPTLLGHWLCRRTAEGLLAGLIVETEAYLVGDPACHAARGMTSRNRVMFGPAGRAYVYLIYGFHHCVNAVCCPQGTAEAVLIRALEPVLGLELMRQRRPVVPVDLARGPGKLCQALGIDRSHDGVDLTRADSPLFIARNPTRRAFLKTQGPILTSPRVGISRAADLHLRFFLSRNPHISRKNPVPD